MNIIGKTALVEYVGNKTAPVEKIGIPVLEVDARQGISPCAVRVTVRQNSAYTGFVQDVCGQPGNAEILGVDSVGLIHHYTQRTHVQVSNPAGYFSAGDKIHDLIVHDTNLAGKERYSVDIRIRRRHRPAPELEYGPVLEEKVPCLREKQRKPARIHLPFIEW